jgi:hypothetical protein
LALLGFIDAQWTTVQRVTVHALDGLRGLFRGSHRDEREAAGAACLAIGYEVDVADGSELLERGTDAISIGVK